MSYTPVYSDIYLLSQDIALWHRLEPALVSKANYFLASSGVSAPTLALANRIVQQGDKSSIAQFAAQVAANGTAQTDAITGLGVVVSANIPDSLIDFIVSTVWPTIAGG